MRAVLDTNVVVSGLLSASGPPARLLDAIASGTLHAVFTDAIMDEYREVLARPTFGFAPDLTATLLHTLAADGDYLPRATLIRSPATRSDPFDQVFLDCAHTAGCLLITGNRKHFPEHPPVTILSPRQAVEQ